MRVIERPDHFTISTDRLEETRLFYEDLGFQVGPRPAFPVPGLWLYLADHPALHVVEVERMPEVRRGALDHMAYRATGLRETVAWAKARGLACNLIRAPRPYSTWQLFFEDPNGVEVELDFDPSEEGPEPA